MNYDTLTFGISPSGYQIVQSTVIASDLTLFATLRRGDQLPNKVLNFLVTLIAFETVQQL